MSRLDPVCREIRKSILLASHASGHGHIPTSYSIVEMLSAVYETMRHRPADPQWSERDIFILSKGHGALGFYSVLAQQGYLSTEELATFGAFESRLGCHPDRFKVPGVEFSTGSLGHGIAAAVGMALAFRINRSDRRVFTLIGDGEANEGTVWEALMVASSLRLANLCVLLDYNQSQVRSLPLTDAAAKFSSFGCDTLEVDGHDLAELKAALVRPASTVKTIVARTVKGRGCPTLVENVFEWHRKSPNPDELARLLAELDQS